VSEFDETKGINRFHNAGVLVIPSAAKDPGGQVITGAQLKTTA
jgi:hypothetical protein